MELGGRGSRQIMNDFMIMNSQFELQITNPSHYYTGLCSKGAQVPQKTVFCLQANRYLLFSYKLYAGCTGSHSLEPSCSL